MRVGDTSGNFWICIWNIHGTNIKQIVPCYIKRFYVSKNSFVYFKSIS